VFVVFAGPASCTHRYRNECNCYFVFRASGEQHEDPWEFELTFAKHHSRSAGLEEKEEEEEEDPGDGKAIIDLVVCVFVSVFESASGWSRASLDVGCLRPKGCQVSYDC
jgi:hypothetical protein